MIQKFQENNSVLKNWEKSKSIHRNPTFQIINFRHYFIAKESDLIDTECLMSKSKN